MKPAIILSANTVALGVARSLGRMGVPVTVVHYGERDVAQYSKYIHSSVKAPHPEEFEKKFIQILLGMADRFRGGLLIPAADETLAVVSRHKTMLQEHFIVACPDWDITRKFIDKKYSYELADACGVPAPRTAVPQSIAEAEMYGRKFGFPCLVKPSQSHLFQQLFHRKVDVVQDGAQLIQACRRAADAGLEVLLQEIIPGGDSEVVNYNAYFEEGRALAEFTCQHLRNGPTGFGSTRVALSKDIPEVIEPGRKILRALGFYGFACIEFKRDPRDGLYKLMDINGRHNLSMSLAVRCGINFPWLEYRHLVFGKPIVSAEFKKNICWIDLARDIGHKVRSPGEEHYTFWQYVRPYLLPHVFAILDWRDMKPFVKKCTTCGSTLFEEHFSRKNVEVPAPAFLRSKSPVDRI